MSALISGNNTVSPITTINGQDVIEYLEAIAASLCQQDPDARWNSLFVADWSWLLALPTNWPT
jgi:hypothetical protein